MSSYHDQIAWDNRVILLIGLQPVLKETSGFSPLCCNMYTHIHTHTELDLVPVNPVFSPFTIQPFSPHSCFLHNCCKIVTNIELRKDEGISQRAEIITLDRWKCGGNWQPKSPVSL